jgi:2-isopropylmalate synthase
VTFLDETLRDGIQSPSVVDPTIDDKLRLIELASDLGIHYIDIGLPGAGRRAVEDCTTIAEHARDAGLPIKLACAARTHVNDVQAIVDISQKVGVPIEVLTFIGSSPIRQYAEDWDVARLLKLSADAIDLGAPLRSAGGLRHRGHHPVAAGGAVEAVHQRGRARRAAADRVRHRRPRHARRHQAPPALHPQPARRLGRPDVGIDWHGHNDRGLGVVNAIFAIEYGADRIHGTALGIGERVGNAALDQILLNLALLGELPEQDLSKLLLWCRTASKATCVPIPVQYPLAGGDAFRTATGVHAAAIIKAEKKGHGWLADRIYSGVPAGASAASRRSRSATTRASPT